MFTSIQGARGDYQLFWHLTPSEIFSVKLAYGLVCNIIGGLIHDTIDTMDKLVWKSIWKIKAPHKVYRFIWRCLHGAIAVCHSLCQRHCTIETLSCPLRGLFDEMIAHLLIGCHHVCPILSMFYPGFTFHLYGGPFLVFYKEFLQWVRLHIDGCKLSGIVSSAF